jgi:3-oxoacyl-[acyl-carrier-protein] synthase-3
MELPQIQIAGTGRHLPATTLGNAAFSELAGLADDWIVQRTGVRERRVAGAGEGTATLGARAAERALASAGLAAADVALLVVATSTPDHLTPPTSCEIQAAIGAHGAACFDMEAGFAGWLHALVVASALVRTGVAANALVVGADKLSTITDRSDPATGPLFGDGAGAVVLLPGDGPIALGATSWWADGRLAAALERPAGGARRPFDAEVLAQRAHLLRMEGTKLFRHSVRTMAEQARSALSRAGLTAGDVDLVVPHQANLRILTAFAEEAGVPFDRVFVNLDRYGNTGSATIPIALDEAREQGRLRGNVLLVSFGAGATAGAALLRGRG